MKRPFEISEELFPFRSHWCDVDGIPIHYLDEGQGPVLLLIHGNFMWSFSYRRLIEKMSRTHRCISIDLAGMGFSEKPHRLGKRSFGYTYFEQSKVIEKVIDELGLREISLLSFDHGGPIGFGVATRRPNLFSKLIIANSWAWSCHNYRATKIWSSLAPLSKHALRKLMLSKDRWLFEDRQDLENPEIWDACTASYENAKDFKPMAVLASQLTRAQSYFDAVGSRLHLLKDKKIDIVWSVKGKGKGLFPEFVDETQFLARWREIFPDAPVTLIDNIGYYGLVVQPAKKLTSLISQDS